MSKFYKTVLLPIKVPDCDWCIEPIEPFRICGHINNDYTAPFCELGVGELNLKQYKIDGPIPKPIECKKLV